MSYVLRLLSFITVVVALAISTPAAAQSIDNLFGGATRLLERQIELEAQREREHQQRLHEQRRIEQQRQQELERPRQAEQQRSAPSARVHPREQVAEVQRLLNELGYDAGPVDGLMGRRTRGAIQAWQLDQGERPEGEPDIPVVRRLREQTAITGRAQSLPSPRDSAIDPARANDLPDPDYLAFLKLYMAANVDLLDDDAMAYDHYAAFGSGHTVDSKAWRDWCRDLRATAGGNEIRRGEILHQAREFLRSRLPEIGNWPKTAIFRSVVERRIGEYDMESESFPLEAPFSGSRDASQYLTGNASSHMLNGCRPHQRHIAGRRFPGLADTEVLGQDLIDRLPMPRERAVVFLDKASRLVRIEMAVEVGPIVFGKTTPVRVLAAKALSKNGEVLHDYPSALFASDGIASVATPSGEEAVPRAISNVPLTGSAIALLAVAEHPNILDDVSLAEMARAQIDNEQKGWEAIDQWLERMNPALNPSLHGQMDPQRPLVAFQWQELQQRDPDLARVMTEKLFVATVPDWSFADRAFDLDPRLKYMKEAFIFERSSIEGRLPEFLAAQMVPVLKQQVKEAASLAPRSFEAEVSLRGVRYDLDRKAFVFSGEDDESAGLPPVSDRRLVFASEAPEAHTGSVTTVLPDDARLRSLRYFYVHRKGPRPRAETDNRISVVRWPAHVAWQGGIVRQAASGGVILAFDREFALPELPLPPSEAERLIRENRLGGGRSSVATAVVRFDIERIALGERLRGLDGRDPLPVAFVRLTGVEIRDAKGDRLASLSADKFRHVSEVLSEIASAEAAARQNKEEKLAAKEHAEAQRAERLEELLQGQSGLLMIRNAEKTNVVERVVTTGGARDVEYRHWVREKGLDLPPEAGSMTSRDMAEALRTELGLAIIVHSVVFERDVFPDVANLDLVVEAFPPAKPDLDPKVRRVLMQIAPEDAPLLMLRRAGDAGMVTRLHDTTTSERVAAALRSSRSPSMRRLDFALPQLPEIEQAAVGDVPALLSSGDGMGIIVTRQGLERIFPRIAAMDITVVRFPWVEFEAGLEKDHTQTASDFDILGIVPGVDGMDEALAHAGKAFEAGELSLQEAGVVLQGVRGRCDEASLTTAPSRDAVGSYCLVVRVNTGAVSHVTLHQVVPGDASEAAAEALKQRYGYSPFLKETRHFPKGGQWTLFGYGGRLSANRDKLGRVAGDIPPTALEAVVWVADGATSILIQADSVLTESEAEAAAPPAIKF